MSLTFFPVTWEEGDAPAAGGGGAEYRVAAFGRTACGRTVCATIRFYPYFFAELPRAWDEPRQRLWLAEACAKHGASPRFSGLRRRTSLWGYQARGDAPFAQLAFDTRAASQAARRRLAASGGPPTYESSASPLTRFLHVRDLRPSAWLTLDRFHHVADRASACDLEVACSFLDVGPADAAQQRARPPLVFASWDIECYSASGNFPLAHNPEDRIIQIGTTLQRFGEAQPFARELVSLGPVDPIPGVEVTAAGGEADLLHAWVALLRRHSPDVMIGYNSAQFDWKYVYERATGEACADDGGAAALEGLGKLLAGGGATRAWTLASSAYGDNAYFALQTPGVLQIDLLQFMRKEHKLDSYSLNAVSAKFLGDAKLDLPPWEIFAKFRSGDPAEVARIGAYCVKDTELPLRLFERLAVFPALSEMANAVRCPVADVVERGQQVRVWSLVLEAARRGGFVVPDGAGMPPQGKYEGATVLTAQTGAYFRPVAALDFASLYPSIMRAHNLCYSTLALDAEAERAALAAGLRLFEARTELGTWKFVQGAPSVLPGLLADLAAFRKAAKRDMAAAREAGDAFAESLFNAKQLAYKVCMNSVYGFCGAAKGYLPCVALAASVTATGRAMIERTRDLVLEYSPGSSVIYGDTGAFCRRVVGGWLSSVVCRGLSGSTPVVDSSATESASADSVMCLLEGPRDLDSQFAAAEALAARISAVFPPPIQLEFEKVYAVYLLFSKKRYAGAMYTRPDRMDKVEVKGLQLVRRDSPPLVRDLCTSVLDAIMVRRDPEEALGIAREALVRLLDDPASFPLDQFVLSKALRGAYKGNLQPHQHVARKLCQRTGESVPSGSRVPFVIMRDAAQPLVALRAEDPAWVRSQGLAAELDTVYYEAQQLRGPLRSLLEVLVPDIDAALFECEEVAGARRARVNAQGRQREITAFFAPKRPRERG